MCCSVQYIERIPCQSPGEYEVRVGWYAVDEVEETVNRLRILDLIPEPTPIPEPGTDGEIEDVPEEPDDYIRIFNFVVNEDGSITTPEIPLIEEEEDEGDATEEAGTGTPSAEDEVSDTEATAEATSESSDNAEDEVAVTATSAE